MRKGWEYKRFDEVFDLQMGKTPDRKNPEYFGGNNVWVSIRDLGDKEIADSNEHITDLAVSNSNIRKVKKGTVIMSFKLTVGKCGIAATDLYTNEAIMAFNTKESFNINSSFLYYYLQCYHWVGSNKAVMGITLNKATISKQYISIPPLSTQLAIVFELDKINELIRLKKEQLKDFDNLAQSLFYEMFGDPAENEKGWEVKKLGDISSIGTGSTPNRKNKDFYKNGTYPWVKSTEVCNLPIYSVEEYITEEALKNSNCTLYPPNTILMAMYGQGKTRGQIGLLKIEACTNQAVAAIMPTKEVVDEIFLSQHLMLMYEHIRNMARGGNQANLNLSIVKSIQIFLPPLSLQRLFAQRIEQIEREKSEVQKSIQDLETLLASRMQYWFE